MTDNKLTNNQCGICADCVPQIDGGSGFNNCAEAHAAQTAGDKAAMNNKQLTDTELAAMVTFIECRLRFARIAVISFSRAEETIEHYEPLLRALRELTERRSAQATALVAFTNALAEKLPGEYYHADGSINMDMINTCQIVNAFKDSLRAAGMTIQGAA